ncbi:ATP-dependent endonuclease [Streptomyces cacaoi]|uniref:ATP-dependent nuclease n=1 Tax=Streptomyces cacaoi TaxID=1898 RepID=UPI00374A37D1
MQICDVRVEGFRSLVDLPSIPIESQTVVTGQNDGGKTALLDALDFLLSGKELTEYDLSYVGASDLGDEGTVDVARAPQVVVTGTFHLSGEEREGFQLSERVEIRRRYAPNHSVSLEVKMLVCEDEDLRDLDSVKVATLKEIAEARGIQPAGRANVKESWISPLRELASKMRKKEEWVNCPADVAASLPVLVHFKGDAVQAPEVVVQNILNSKLREYSKSEEAKKKISELEDHLADSLAADIDQIRQHVTKRCGFSSVRLNPQVQVRPSLLRVDMSVSSKNGHDVPLSAAGTGRSRRISLALWESGNEVLGGAGNGQEADQVGIDKVDLVFVYDEPDTHLDYEHQRRVMNLIHQQSARPNARVVVATHSLNLIDGVDIANVVHLRLSSEGTYPELLSQDSEDSEVKRHLSTIATSLGFRNSVLLHERFFVAVEGPSETAAFPILFKKHFGVPIQSAGICLWDGGSNEGALKFARFLKKHDRDVAFVVDKDSRTNQKKVFRDDKLKEYGFNLEHECIYIGQPNELEDLFEDEDWAEVANELWKPNGERREWAAEDFTQHRGKKFSSEVLDMLKTGSNEGPKGKDVLMMGIATHVGKEKIPSTLIETFDRLVSLAQDAGPHYPAE